MHSATVSGTSYEVPIDLDSNTTHYWRVTAKNFCGDGAASSTFSFTTVALTCQQFDSTNVPVTLNDATGNISNPTPGVTDSTLDVSSAGAIHSVEVIGLQGTHTWINDLSFDLLAPDGATVRVMDRSCSNEDDFHLSLADDAAGSWPCPPTDQATYPPSNPLSGFQGLEAGGQWTLRVTDHAREDTGTLDAWALHLCIEDASVQTYTLTYTAGSNGSINGTSPQSVDHGNDGTSVEAMPDTGYHFVQWSDGSTDNPRTDTNVTSDITVEAQFAINTYTVSGLVGSGNGNITPPSQSVDHGNTTTLTVTPEAGWSIDSVSGCGGSLSGDTYTTGTITGNCTVTANFVINTYELNYSAGANGSLNGNASQTVDHGSDGTSVEAVPDSGYRFDQWSDGNTANPRTDTNVQGDVTVEAQFVVGSYTVTFVDHDGSELRVETVDYGGSATAPADPTREGYTFTGWDVDFDNVTSDLTVTAQYEVITYTVTFADYDGSELKVETVDHGSGATAPAEPARTGYTFTGWDVTYDNVTSDMTVTAQYELTDPNIFSDRFEPEP